VRRVGADRNEVRGVQDARKAHLAQHDKSSGTVSYRQSALESDAAS
jgi:hypothetical protein